jgi:hypothetical protein
MAGIGRAFIGILFVVIALLRQLSPNDYLASDARSDPIIWAVINMLERASD